jgi:hypothetical protein
MQKQAQKPKTEKPPQAEEAINPFAEMLRVMDVEHLIRFRRRLEKVGRKRMVEILTDEIEEREALEKERSIPANRIRPT